LCQILPCSIATQSAKTGSVRKNLVDGEGLFFLRFHLNGYFQKSCEAPDVLLDRDNLAFRLLPIKN
jgi:hypothetical protein